jgi:hypothetical protein
VHDAPEHDADLPSSIRHGRSSRKRLPSGLIKGGPGAAARGCSSLATKSASFRDSAAETDAWTGWTGAYDDEAT